VCVCAEHVTQALLEGGASIRGVILSGSGWRLVDVLEGEAGGLHSRHNDLGVVAQVLRLGAASCVGRLVVLGLTHFQLLLLLESLEVLLSFDSNDR
jgi:hypothetical protein